MKTRIEPKDIELVRRALAAVSDGPSEDAEWLRKNGYGTAPAATETPRPKITILDDTEIAQLGTPAQLIEGRIPANGFVLIVGEKGTLKTFLALDISAHVSLGMPDWHGAEVRQGRVLYIYAEGRTGITPRVEAWKAYHRTGNLGILFVPHRVTLNDAAQVTDLIAAILERTDLEGVALIVVDTLNRNFAGNENSAEDMSAFVRGCDRLREVTGATVLVVHHKGHGEGDRGRGSSVLDAAADTIIFCTRDEDRLTIKCTKQKDAAEFAPLALEAISVGPSLVLKPTGLTTGGLKGQRLLCLRSLAESIEKGWTSKAWQEATGIAARSSFFAAQEWLKANSYVNNVLGRWVITDAGRMALGSLVSSRSSGSPVGTDGPQAKESSRGGVSNTPTVDRAERQTA